MKTDDLMILGIAGLIGWFLLTRTSAGQQVQTVIGANFNPTTTAGDQGFGKLNATWEGWRYYDSGYAKDPDGNIYFNGMRITG